MSQMKFYRLKKSKRRTKSKTSPPTATVQRCLESSIKACKPAVEFDVEDITVALAKLPAGAALSSLVCYLRKKAAGGINVADATSEHIALSASVGAVTPVGPRRVRVNVNSFSLSTASAIS